jgi:uncharacterized protein
VKRPILVGGLGLTAGLYLLSSLTQWTDELGAIALLMATGAGIWWKYRHTRTPSTPKFLALDVITPVIIEQALAEVTQILQQLTLEATDAAVTISSSLQVSLDTVQQKVDRISQNLSRKTLSCAIVGGRSAGKTSLLHALAGQWASVEGTAYQLTFEDTPPLFIEDQDTTFSSLVSQPELQQSDVILFVTTGDLTDSEHQVLVSLQESGQRFIVAFNKQDQYLPEDRSIVLHQIQKRLQNLGVSTRDVLAIATQPSDIKVRHHQANGGFQEWIETPTPDIQGLIQHLQTLVAQEGQSWVWATALREAMQLKTVTKGYLNEIRRDRALPLIEQFQWIAATTAFANPLPVLDLVSTAAINAQLIVDLGAIYQQKFSLEQAQKVAKTLGELLVKLGLVEFTTQAIAGVLKSHVTTFVAGGALQGMSAAYLTRLAGLSLVDYFQEQDSIPINEATFSLNSDRLSQILKAAFQANGFFLQAFVKQGLGRLLPEPIQLS